MKYSDGYKKNDLLRGDPMQFGISGRIKNKKARWHRRSKARLQFDKQKIENQCPKNPKENYE